MHPMRGNDPVTTTTNRAWRAITAILLTIMLLVVLALNNATSTAQAAPAQAGSPRPKPGTIQAGGQTISYYTPAQLAQMGGTSKEVSRTSSTAMTIHPKSGGVTPYDFAVGNGHTGGSAASLWIYYLYGDYSLPLCVYGYDTVWTNAPAPYEIDLTADYYWNGTTFLQQLNGANYNLQTFTMESNCFLTLGGLYENTMYGQAIWGDATGQTNATDFLAP